jgi:hypothetical protein
MVSVNVVDGLRHLVTQTDYRVVQDLFREKPHKQYIFEKLIGFKSILNFYDAIPND